MKIIKKIFLHNIYDKFSRIILNKYKNEFEEILNYPECINTFRHISKFPTIAIEVEEDLEKINDFLYIVENKKYLIFTFSGNNLTSEQWYFQLNQFIENIEDELNGYVKKWNEKFHDNYTYMRLLDSEQNEEREN